MNTPDYNSKICKSCQNEFPLTKEFWYPAKNVKDGFNGKCKTCFNEQVSRWKENNKGKVSEILKRYYQKNKAKITQRNKNYRVLNYSKRLDVERRSRIKNDAMARNREYRLRNPDRYKDIAKKYRETHILEVKRRRKIWKENNKDRVNSDTRNRRARKRNAQGTHTGKDIEQLYIKQNACCFHCGVSIATGYHADHWIPLSRGGSNSIENIRLLCSGCNLRKGSKLPHEWSEKYRKTDIAD